MYYLTAKAEFDSAHFLHGHQGKCSNIHGHRWTIVAKIKKDALITSGPSKGMILDFSDFKKALRSLADDFDHAFLIEENTLKPSTFLALEEEGFRLIILPFRPTAEHMADYFYHRLQEAHLPMDEVAVYETPDNCAIYREFLP